MNIRAWFQKAAAKLAALWNGGFRTIFSGVLRDIIVGAQILPRMWDLYVQIVVVSSANYFLWINSITRLDTIWTNPFVVIMSVLGWNVMLIIAGIFLFEIFQFFKNGKEEKENGGEDAAYFLIYFYSVGIVSRLVDGIILWIIIFHGFVLSVAVCTLLFFFIVVHWLKIYQRFQDEGIDLQKIVYLRNLHLKPKKSCGEKVTVWILKRKATIFIFGSAFVLDPDLVTLLLRKKNYFTWRECFKTTLPSAAQCILVWAIIYQLGFWGYHYFRWFVD